MTQISADLCRELPTVGATHGTQVQIHVDSRGSAGPGPVARHTARGRRLDHRRRHGELAHARPEKKAGVSIHDPGVHQHSPLVNGTPDLFK
jgi:hypothetical protein